MHTLIVASRQDLNRTPTKSKRCSLSIISSWNASEKLIPDISSGIFALCIFNYGFYCIKLKKYRFNLKTEIQVMLCFLDYLEVFIA